MYCATSLCLLYCIVLCCEECASRECGERRDGEREGEGGREDCCSADNTPPKSSCTLHIIVHLYYVSCITDTPPHPLLSALCYSTNSFHSTDRASSYFLTKTILELPLNLIQMFVQFIIVYYMINMQVRVRVRVRRPLLRTPHSCICHDTS